MDFEATGGGGQPLTEFSFKEGESYSVEQIAHLRRAAEVFPVWRISGGAGVAVAKAKAPRLPDGSAQGWEDLSKEVGLSQALEAVRAGPAQCVGLLVHSGAPGAVCIDLDHVVRAGALLPAGAHALGLFAGAYVEVSPSGTGLRILCSGDVSPGKFKGKISFEGLEHSFEVYAASGTARFVRMTGSVVRGTGGRVLEPSQCGVDWVLNSIRGAGAGTSSPDNVSTKGAGSSGPRQTVDAVFESLATYRPEAEPGAVLEALRAKATTL